MTRVVLAVVVLFGSVAVATARDIDAVFKAVDDACPYFAHWDTEEADVVLRAEQSCSAFIARTNDALKRRLALSMRQDYFVRLKIYDKAFADCGSHESDGRCRHEKLVEGPERRGDYESVIAILEFAMQAAKASGDRGTEHFVRSEIERVKGLMPRPPAAPALEAKAASPTQTAAPVVLPASPPKEAVAIVAAPVTKPDTQPVAGDQESIGRRVALVIGNARYADVEQLKNPSLDARAVAAALRHLGFAEVIERYDLSLQGMTEVLKEFGDKAVGADWGVVYFAGHGIELNGVPHLVPVDAKLVRDTHVQDETVALDRVLSKVEGAKRLRLVILDACRNNPFTVKMERTAGLGRSVGRGLSRIEPEGGSLVAYSAKHGTIAQDGSGANSPFAAALLTYIEEPGLEVQYLFRKVRDHVLEKTGRAQEPYLYGSLGSETFYFKK